MILHSEKCLKVFVYEAMRLFHDRLVNENDRKKLKNILQEVIEHEWNQSDIVETMDQVYFVTDGNQKTLTKLQEKDWTQSVDKGILMSVGECATMFNVKAVKYKKIFLIFFKISECRQRN